MGAIKSLQRWIRRERPVSGPGHWKGKPNLQKGSLTPAGPCGWFLVHRGHCHMEKGWRGWVWSFGKLWEDDVKFKRKTQMLFFFFLWCCWLVSSPALPQSSWYAGAQQRFHCSLWLCRASLQWNDGWERQLKQPELGDNESWCEEIRLLSSSLSFSRQFRWMKLLNERSLWTNLLSSQVFASAEKKLWSWISFCARRVALYLRLNQRFTVFSLSSLINWSG